MIQLFIRMSTYLSSQCPNTWMQSEMMFDEGMERVEEYFKTLDTKIKQEEVQNMALEWLETLFL